MTKPSTTPLPPHIFVDNAAAWQTCLVQLQTAPRIAIDLEANSMFAYREQICLMQISLPDQDYIVDPLDDLDFAPLGKLIADPAIEKILHAAEYDLILMKRQFGWQLHNLFDTMWAARVLGYSRYGLANLLEELFDVRLDKRYQKSNWCRRPLTEPQLVYAQHDTHHLFRLRDHLAAELVANGRDVEAREIFEEQTHVRLPDDSFDPNAFWYLNGTRDLPRSHIAMLKELYLFRDQEARKRDLPLFKVINDRTLLALAESAPRSMAALSNVHGMTPGQVRRYGRGILSAIERGRGEPMPRTPRRGERQPDVVVDRYDRLHTWRKLRAQKRGVESDVILSREALWEIAHANPQSIEELQALSKMGDWRCQTYGEDILGILGHKPDHGRNGTDPHRGQHKESGQ